MMLLWSLGPGHHDEVKALGPLVVVDDLSVLYVAVLCEQHDVVVLLLPVAE